MTAFERFLEHLPPERRVEAALALENMAREPNSPIFSLYTEVLASIQDKSLRMEGRLAQKLAESERRENELAAQLGKTHTEVKSGRQDVAALSGESLWRRVFASRIIGAAIGASIWTAMVVGLTTYLVDTKVRAVDPVFHERIDSLGSKMSERDQAYHDDVKHLIALQEQAAVYFDSVRDTQVTTAAETLIGKSLAPYAIKINEKTITLGFGERRVTVNHNLTPMDFTQLKIASQAAKKIEVK